MLENYYWRGNIRQLKNVAEQISAIEESRVITAEVLSHYLPHEATGSQMVAGDSERTSHIDERELLYKFLLDMKNDMNEIKQMLRSMGLQTTPHTAHPAEPSYAALLPSHDTPSSVEEPMYADSEDVTYQAPEQPSRPQTKEQMQREAILRALRNNGGRRKEAAEELFMSERTLYRKIKELGINE